MNALEHPAFMAFSAVVVAYMVASWQWPTKFRYLLDKGNAEPSLARIGQFVALLTMTWGFVALVIANKLTEWYALFYGATFAGAQAFSLYMKVKGDQGKPEVKP